MRTTIEIPGELRQKLLLEEALQHRKGFSGIIVEALEQYFQSGQEGRKQRVKVLKGILSQQEYKEEIKALKEERQHWRE